ncbi:hypothetical protein SAMN04488058_11877 [Deinococcus reticulitermitis]|uniref:Uncharacterized protein n=1 Tax=Deinococcus reticulitermitis TaxID=856736 RepID=A0A1H7BYY9_9DEIO|nr:hypothetical protein [Deinococcus reticulitermitis]SEJ78565.1 hypothetical protein SAMN04488058_11877 [Deinococcus reticulitermitis]
MKILSRALVLIGLIVLLVGMWFLINNHIAINQLHAIAYSNRSTDGPNPNQGVLLQTGLAAAGGFLMGLGLSMPKR